MQFSRFRHFLLQIDDGNPNPGGGSGGGGDSGGATGASVRDSLNSAVQSVQQRSEAPTSAMQQALNAPEHWPDPDKQLFTKHPRDVQEYLLRRDKEYSTGHQKVTTEFADYRKWADPIREIFKPYADGLKRQNLTEAQVIQNYINAELALRKDPVQALIGLAKSYKANPAKLVLALQDLVDPSAIAAEQDAQPQDPVVKQMLERMERLEAERQQEVQMRQQAQEQTLQRALISFAETKAEDGKTLAHAHMSNPTVINLMKTYIESGVVDLVKAGSLQAGLKQAYDMATYAHPETREALLKSAQEAQAKKAADEAKARIAKAKQAGVSVSGASPETDVAATAGRKSSVRDSLRANAVKAGYLNA